MATVATEGDFIKRAAIYRIDKGQFSCYTPSIEFVSLSTLNSLEERTVQEAFESVRNSLALIGLAVVVYALIWIVIRIRKTLGKNQSAQQRTQGPTIGQHEEDDAVAACAIEGLTIH